MRKPIVVLFVGLLGLILLASSGCSNTEAKQPAPQALPVNTQTVSLAPVPRVDEYVATVKSRRSASIQPQVDGSLTRILVKSGDHVRAGQALMTIDPLVTSKQNLDLAVQAYENSKADWEASTSASVSQRRQLAYYNLTAPFAGVVGDIPVHIGDYVSPQTLLTTVDENTELEAYVYIPTERAADIRMGLPVEVVTSGGELIESTKVNFISQQVDNALQGILVKAPLHSSLDKFRNAQLVKARVVWSTAPAPTIPVLAVTRIGGQSFVYVATLTEHGSVAKQRAVTLGDTIGNDYAVDGGLKPGEKVIVSGTQFLIDGAPVKPIS